MEGKTITEELNILIRTYGPEEAWLSNQACGYVCTVFMNALGVTVEESAGAAADNAKPRETGESGKAETEALDGARAEAEAQAREAALSAQAETEAKAAKGKKDPDAGKEGLGECWIHFAIYAVIFYFWRIKGDNLIKYFELYISERSEGITDLPRWVPFAVAQGGCVAAGLLFSVIECVKPGKAVVELLLLLALVGVLVTLVAELFVDPSMLLG